MKLYLRLHEILRKRGPLHGQITKIADTTGLNRSQVADLLFNRSKTYNRQSLGLICEYLLSEGLVKRADLPAVLFGRVPNDFWMMLANAERLEFCMGARRYAEIRNPFVMSADAELQAMLMHQITRTRVSEWSSDSDVHGGGPQLLDMRFVPAPERAEANEKGPQVAAKNYYKEAMQFTNQCLFLLGSMKSNAAWEIGISHFFPNAKAFREEKVATATERAAPFYFLYRPDDLQPKSLCGGLSLARDDRRASPGIYYETRGGKWERCGSDDKRDAGLVFYQTRKDSMQTEIAIGGFSSTATRCLAHALGANRLELWPPRYQDANRDIGAFIVDIRYKTDRNNVTNGLASEFNASLIEIEPAVIERRVKGKKKSAPKRKAPTRRKSKSRAE